MTLHLRTITRAAKPTVLFLHAIGTSGWMWQEIGARLDDFTCIAPDLPGHGLSHAVQWVSMEETADAIAAIIRAHVDGKKAHIVGLSLGAYVGLTLMSRHPDTVDRAMLSGLNVLPLPNVGLMSAAAWVMAPLLKTGPGARMNAKALNIPDADFPGYRQSMRQLSLRSFLTASDNASHFGMPANVAAIDTPTLLVAGEREHTLVHQALAVLGRQLPNSRQVVVPGLGHGWCAEDRGLFVATVDAWCKGSPLPPRLREQTGLPPLTSTASTA